VTLFEFEQTQFLFFAGTGQVEYFLAGELLSVELFLQCLEGASGFAD